MREQVEAENAKQKAHVAQMKQKLDREGVNYLEDESEMGRKEGQNTTPGKYANTPRGMGPSNSPMDPIMPEYGRPVQA